MREIRNICLYCGAASGDDPQFLAAAEAFGQALAVAGIGLVAFILSSLQVVFRWVYERSTRME